MASCSAPLSIFDEHRFRKEFNQQLFESHARRRKIIPEVGFNLDEDERTELHPLAKGWQEFIIHSLVPTGNKSEITIARALLIHCIIRGEEVRAEDIIADNITVIAQGLPNKGNLAFPSTIYKLCKDAGVPLREFRRTSRIPEVSYITAKIMESTRIPRNLPQPQQEDDDEDEPIPQAGEAMMKKRSSSHTKTSSHRSKAFPIFSHNMKANTMRPSKALNHTSLACSFSSRPSMKTWRNLKRITWKR
ncbi:hypothetical protein PIB30_079354 [Stylosanthes scabra]|uniref:Putative plant transposon protein domain-containing protein n=1 Tax=Stylosanthes scabra TaxID=79078 RepID=A0ABU6WPD7_9FABA|nr:hypothetical protein [Stylosanthes scabra]